jgi:hypothetical protein
MCLRGLYGDIYAPTLSFFLEYYADVFGIDTAFVYMEGPGPRTTAAVAELVKRVSEQKQAGQRPAMDIVLVPWCVGKEATYGCEGIDPSLPRPPLADFHESAQELQNADCMYRAAGVFRWATVVDYDEYILPHRGVGGTRGASSSGGQHRFMELVHSQRALPPSSQGSPAPGPIEIGFASTFAAAGCLVDEGELPDSTAVSEALDRSAAAAALGVGDERSISTSSFLDSGVPYPVWTPLMGRGAYGYNVRSKYAYDPLWAGWLGTHSMRDRLCAITPGARPPPWDAPCDVTPFRCGWGSCDPEDDPATVVLHPETVARIVHIRAPPHVTDATRGRAPPPPPPPTTPMVLPRGAGECKRVTFETDHFSWRGHAGKWGPTVERAWVWLEHAVGAHGVVDWSLANWWFKRHPTPASTAATAAAATAAAAAKPP